MHMLANGARLVHAERAKQQEKTFEASTPPLEFFLIKHTRQRNCCPQKAPPFFVSHLHLFPRRGRFSHCRRNLNSQYCTVGHIFLRPSKLTVPEPGSRRTCPSDILANHLTLKHAFGAGPLHFRCPGHLSRPIVRFCLPIRKKLTSAALPRPYRNHSDIRYRGRCPASLLNANAQTLQPSGLQRATAQDGQSRDQNYVWVTLPLCYLALHKPCAASYPAYSKPHMTSFYSSRERGCM
ncbi:uncharacterized protein BDR25DRAFT_14131 [Lindgomyces ingoldianus]|uniref:Uncharacterized protein n=1 Tax=Lindgomyces ingoldianus TaxID=673940 RepID=A0ACB6QZC3_9PLEO|nr:uncharacterized protein BDR25DRAFT_14131 [Lindgomyces ingoldianus]KAF2472414.1 hypothetical protein BDR25DRAFT_14131 [Lindgomyces ingoldianus]